MSPDSLTAALLLAAGALPFALAWWAARRRARRGERRSALLTQALDTTPCYFAVYDRDRTLLACNGGYRGLHAAAFARLRGRIRYDDVIRISLTETHPPERLEAAVTERIARHEGELLQTFDGLYADGRWMLISKRRLPGGEVAGIAVDITSIKAREQALAASEARLRALVDDAPVGIWHLDTTGRTVFANARLAALFPGAEAPGSLAEAGLVFRARDGQGPFGFALGRETEARLARPDGDDLALLIAASPWLTDADGGVGAVLTVLDITALHHARAQVEQLARHDALTRLGNRDAFATAVEIMLASGVEGALLLIDLDDFKVANDRYGHAAGDAVLVAVADRLRAAVRPGDAVCRLGGDEFALVAPGIGPEPAAALAGRLARVLAEPVVHDGIELRVGASIGTALAPAHGATLDALLRAADLALYEAKAAGRGRSVPFRPGLRAAADTRLAVREALAAALPAGELALHFQPQYHLASGALVGAEALLRWRSAALARDVPPGELLAAAAEARLTAAVDAWVLRQACETLAGWTNHPNAPPRLAINVAAATLRDTGFADRVAGALLTTGVAPARLEIELPEDLAVRDLDALGDTLGKLSEFGVRLALDDFGAGLSSLAHVVRLPVDLLKLDRSIVAGLDGRTPPRAVLRATMALARGMGIEVMAEGVETDAQVFALRREGCHVAQGYLLGRPMPEAALLGQPAARRAFG